MESMDGWKEGRKAQNGQLGVLGLENRIWMEQYGNYGWSYEFEGKALMDYLTFGIISSGL